MILTRTGKVNSQMIFEEGRQHTSLYETPFGELTVDIQTSRLRHNLSEPGRRDGDPLLHRRGAHGDRPELLQDPGEAETVSTRSGPPGRKRPALPENRFYKNDNESRKRFQT